MSLGIIADGVELRGPVGLEVFGNVCGDGEAGAEHIDIDGDELPPNPAKGAPRAKSVEVLPPQCRILHSQTKTGLSNPQWVAHLPKGKAFEKKQTIGVTPVMFVASLLVFTIYILHS